MTDLIRGTSLAEFAGLVTGLGGDPAALLRAQGIDPAIAGAHERFLTYTALARVIGAAACELSCPDFGLRLGCRQGIQILGPVAVIIRHAATVAEALEGASRYLHTYSPAVRTGVDRGPHSSDLEFGFTVRQLAHRDQMTELSLAIALDVFRLLLGDDFVPLRVTMQHRRISPPEVYRPVFGAEVVFEADRNTIVFPSALLASEIRGRDAAARALAETYLSPIRPDVALPDHVHHLVRRLLEVDQATLVGVARALTVHPRVLQRNLAAAGTTFEQILDDVRRTMAWELAATGLRSGRIATMLGYSEQSSYTRACRRWFGESPRQLAARRRATAASG
ncbi:AraC family transcriptional regulator [Nocardia sp. BMG111209]|uniref:AraC family transcriptional regulator n=1 Tax=Nocardia sp. BMG111209 TaxID=1160137 RepID=UPI00037A86BF|nr:AraC family transcriptional regulator [Nocardia sp. BMG111209]